uniref:MOB family member 4, phocein n=1 Tax=Cyprinus carpio carpio TaxID=630221 RepID=A0A8C1F2Q6_CYPCA
MVMAEGTAVLRRNRPGTKAKDFYNWSDESFEEMDSTLAVQQYIQQNIRSDCSNIEKIMEPPEGQDEGVWKYEHLRQFCLELNGLAVKLQNECHPDTCTQMTATEQWIFLCAAHKTPKECPAIDYTRHTLDGAACLLNSNKYFPSRVSIKESSVAKLGSVCRRIYRIFSHAYFHHRQIFDKYEIQVTSAAPSSGSYPPSSKWDSALGYPPPNTGKPPIPPEHGDDSSVCGSSTPRLTE